MYLIRNTEIIFSHSGHLSLQTPVRLLICLACLAIHPVVHRTSVLQIGRKRSCIITAALSNLTVNAFYVHGIPNPNRTATFSREYGSSHVARFRYMLSGLGIHPSAKTRSGRPFSVVSLPSRSRRSSVTPSSVLGTHRVFFRVSHTV